jgi:hypothetical protein
VPAILAFVRAFEGGRSRVFTEKLIRKKAFRRSVAAAVFPVPDTVPVTQNPAKLL